MNARMPGGGSVRLERALIMGVLAAAGWLGVAETRARRAERAWRLQIVQSEALPPIETGASSLASERW